MVGELSKAMEKIGLDMRVAALVSLIVFNFQYLFWFILLQIQEGG